MDAAERRLATLLALGVLPWNLVGAPGAWTAFFPIGLVNLAPPRNLITVYDFVFVLTGPLPDYILAWPLGILVYVATLGSAALALVDREDPRLTGGLLVLLGASQALFAWGFGRRPGYLVVPVATFLAPVVAWWYYWPLVDSA